MSLPAGLRVGPFEVVGPLGAGGMGEVYRARDVRLGRDVALKVLPESFTADHERLARFDREARTLASLNHPNIASIYGLEESNGTRFLVLELVEGDTLAQRLTRGPLRLEDALAISRQIAHGLEAAHGKGVVHRDLKPANIKVTPEGKVKVLDFGLAKAVEGDASAPDLSHSPTATYDDTGGGVILGTAAYMSPEQARGQPVDKRTDVWSFGCVLYEMLTGGRAFAGETVSDTIAAILKQEPDWQAVPPTVPVIVRSLLRRCLQKDRDRRLHDIADARIELDEALAEGAVATAAVHGKRTWRWNQVLAWILTVGVLVLAAGSWRGSRPSPTRPVMRFAVGLPSEEPLAIGNTTSLALSRDGTKLAYAATRAGKIQLFVKAMDQMEAAPLAGTDGAGGPFFSPDGQWVGFFADGKLKKVSALGGVPLTLCDAPQGRGATWGPDGWIMFSPTINTGLSRVRDSGGTPVVIVPLDLGNGERSHRWPDVLPGGKAVLFAARTGGSFDDARIVVQSLVTGERKILVEGGSCPRYAPTGHLIFARGGTLMAVPFDPARLATDGPPVLVLQDVITDTGTGAAQYALSESGTLAYVPGGATGTERMLVWVDRRGAAQPLTDSRGGFRWPRLSPDGRRLAVRIEAEKSLDVWIDEIPRRTLTRLTVQGSNVTPIWTPDGRHVAFGSTAAGAFNLFWAPADGSGGPERLLASEHTQYPASWSPDGRLLAFTEIDPVTGADIGLFSLRERRAQTLLRTPFHEGGAMFSPDGRLLAYTSNESGRFEVYVQPFPGPGRKWQISAEGGGEPVWSRSGRELFYRSGDRMMAVAVTTSPSFAAGTPTLLFEGRYVPSSLAEFANYDVAPDGQRFVMIRGGERESAPTHLRLVIDWLEDLKRRVPGGSMS